MSNPYDHTATDVRRAAALIAHHARSDAAGMEAVFAEVRDDPEPGSSTTRLMFAVLGLYQHMMPALTTPMGMSWLADQLTVLAQVEESSKP